MRTVSLECCLSKYTFSPGKEADHIGLGVGSGRRYSKYLLSHDAKKGWNIVKLNRIQLILRNIFGFYATTRAASISKGWNILDSKAQNALISTYTRLNQVILKTAFIPLGNAPLSQASVICFPEEHGDRTYHQNIAQVINRYYKKGDIILVEGVAAGKVGRSQITPLLNQECQIQGWEPADFEKHHFGLFDIHTKALTRLHDLGKKMASVIPDKKRYTLEDIRLLKDLLERDFYPTYTQLAEHFAVAKSPIPHAKAHIEHFKNKMSKLFQLVEKGSFDKDSNAIKFTLFSLMADLEKNQTLAAYKNVDAATVKKLIGSVAYRNLTLCAEVHKHRKLGKKVFVIAGLGHLLYCKYINKLILAHTKSSLNKHKFVLLPPQRYVDEYNFLKLNSDLPRQSI